jgi:hypothetical protein
MSYAIGAIVGAAPTFSSISFVGVVYFFHCIFKANNSTSFIDASVKIGTAQIVGFAAVYIIAYVAAGLLVTRLQSILDLLGIVPLSYGLIKVMLYQIFHPLANVAMI